MGDTMDNILLVILDGIGDRFVPKLNIAHPSKSENLKNA